MKKDTHPTYYPEAKVTCACGNSFTVGATVKDINVELCSECHPFYTGKQKLVDTARRVEKFQERTTKTAKDVIAAKKAKVAGRKVGKPSKRDAK
jgi:large subunit ribosomal protein L31